MEAEVWEWRGSAQPGRSDRQETLRAVTKAESRTGTGAGGPEREPYSSDLPSHPTGTTWWNVSAQILGTCTSACQSTPGHEFESCHCIWAGVTVRLSTVYVAPFALVNHKLWSMRVWGRVSAWPPSLHPSVDSFLSPSWEFPMIISLVLKFFYFGV